MSGGLESGRAISSGAISPVVRLWASGRDLIGGTETVLEGGFALESGT